MRKTTNKEQTTDRTVGIARNECGDVNGGPVDTCSQSAAL